MPAHYPAVKVVKLMNCPTFNLSRARNLGAAEAESDWLFFFDADIIFDPEIEKWFHANELTESSFFRQEPTEDPGNSETTGSCLVSRNSFDRVGGYDDVMTGWGSEDADFYSRLKGAGIHEVFFDTSYFSAISHSDRLRMEFNPIENKDYQNAINAIYFQIKTKILRKLDVTEMSRPARAEILRQVMSHSDLALIMAAAGKDVITVTLEPQLLNSKAGADAELSFEAGRLTFYERCLSRFRTCASWIGFGAFSKQVRHGSGTIEPARRHRSEPAGEGTPSEQQYSDRKLRSRS